MPSFYALLLPLAIAGSLSQPTLANTPSTETMISIITNYVTVHTIAFSFLILFIALLILPFLVTLGRICGLKERLPPEASTAQYSTGRLFDWLAFVTVRIWLVQLIMHAVYIRREHMLNPKGYFPDSAHVVRYALDHLADFFVAASVLRLVHYRRALHSSADIPSFSTPKKTLDAGLLFAHLSVIACTTVLFSLNKTNPEKYGRWFLISYDVYTLVYLASSLNIFFTVVRVVKALNAKLKADKVIMKILRVPISIMFHTYFKQITAILYVRNRRNPINFNVLRVFEVIVLGGTYYFVMNGLASAGGASEEDRKKVKALKEERKQRLEMRRRMELEGEEVEVKVVKKGDEGEKQEGQEQLIIL